MRNHMRNLDSAGRGRIPLRVSRMLTWGLEICPARPLGHGFMSESTQSVLREGLNPHVGGFSDPEDEKEVQRVFVGYIKSRCMWLVACTWHGR